MSKNSQITPSSGNVFADLGLENADELKAKADLAFEIVRILDERNLNQTQAAAVLEVDQPKVSALRRGRLDGFSMERLYRFLGLLGKRVEIVVHNAPKSNVARIKVVRENVRGTWKPVTKARVAAKSASKSARRKAAPTTRKRGV